MSVTSETAGFLNWPRRKRGIFPRKYILLAVRVPLGVSSDADRPVPGCEVSRLQIPVGWGRGPGACCHLQLRLRRLCSQGPRHGAAGRPDVLQELLTVGRRAVLVDDSLRLCHQQVREQDTACFEDLCKTATPLGSQKRTHHQHKARGTNGRALTRSQARRPETLTYTVMPPATEETELDGAGKACCPNKWCWGNQADSRAGMRSDCFLLPPTQG